MAAKFTIVAYSAALHEAALSFDCGSSSVFNAFIKGPDAADASMGKTFVLLNSDGAIVGYYNIGVGDVERSDGYQLLKCGGAIHINMLAIDKHYRGVTLFTSKGGTHVRCSDILLNDCLRRIRYIRDKYVGFMFVTLSATREGVSLYERFQFTALEDDMSFSSSDMEKTGKGRQMYLPLDYEP